MSLLISAGISEKSAGCVDCVDDAVGLDFLIQYTRVWLFTREVPRTGEHSARWRGRHLPWLSFVRERSAVDRDGRIL